MPLGHGEDTASSATAADAGADSPEAAEEIGTLHAVTYRLRAEASPPAVYANHIFATFDGPHFVVRFAQTLPPVARSKEDWEKIESGQLDAPVVATLIVPVPRFVEAIESISALIESLKAKGLIQAPIEAEQAP